MWKGLNFCGNVAKLEKGFGIITKIYTLVEFHCVIFLRFLRTKSELENESILIQNFAGAVSQHHKERKSKNFFGGTTIQFPLD
jgi:hypothetical protein